VRPTEASEPKRPHLDEVRICHQTCWARSKERCRREVP
jgi:hypothetical protein